MNSVTRFGQILKVLGNFLRGLFGDYRNFKTILVIFCLLG